MENDNYLIFDIIKDYLKSKKGCMCFRLISKETKDMSQDLYNRHYSASKLYNIMMNDGFDKNFIECDYIGDFDINCWLKIFAISCVNIFTSSKDLIYINYIDRFNPIKRNKVRLKILIMRRRKESILFSSALDWPEMPKLKLRKYLVYDEL